MIGAFIHQICVLLVNRITKITVLFLKLLVKAGVGNRWPQPDPVVLSRYTLARRIEKNDRQSVHSGFVCISTAHTGSGTTKAASSMARGSSSRKVHALVSVW